MTEIKAPIVVSKLTIKSMGADPKRGTQGKTALVRLYGVASGVVTKPDSRGGLIDGLVGNFEGINLETGERYSSGVAYLPSGIQSLIQSGVETGELDAKDKPVYNSVKFALELYSVPATNPIGYSFEAIPLIQASDADPMAELRNSLPEYKALPAAKKKADKGEEKAE